MWAGRDTRYIHSLTGKSELDVSLFEVEFLPINLGTLSEKCFTVQTDVYFGLCFFSFCPDLREWAHNWKQICLLFLLLKNYLPTEKPHSINNGHVPNMLLGIVQIVFMMLADFGLTAEVFQWEGLNS